MSTLAIIDYGMGNLHSVAKAVEHVAPELKVVISADAEQILDADRVIFPGVGAIRDCMAEIHRLGFDALVKQVMERGTPLLGICVGMQALLEHSEENGGVDAIGLMPGNVRYFGDNLVEAETKERLKVPHMGWNEVRHTRNHPMWHGIEDGERFYFVHSYYAEPGDDRLVVGRTHYSRDFAAALARDNVFAVQFHPEKSQHAGLQLLANFSVWDGRC